MRKTPLLLVVLLALSACPEGEDPGPAPDESDAPRPPEVHFPRDAPSAEERLVRWIRGLEHGDRPEVSRAVRQFAWSGPEAVEALARVADERGGANPGLVQNILRALERIGTPAAASAASPHLAHPSSVVRERAVAALGAGGGPEAVAALFGALGDDEPRVVGRVVLALGELQPEGAGAAILRAADRFGPGLQALAAGVLATLDHRPALPWLREVVETSPGLEDRLAAATALHALGDGSGLERLRAEVEQPGHWVSIVAMLVECGHPEGETLLRAGLASEEEGRRSEARAVAMASPREDRAALVVEAIGSDHELQRRQGLAHAAAWLRAGSAEVEAVLRTRLGPEHEVLTRIEVVNVMEASGREDLLDRIQDEIRERPGTGTGPGSFAFGAGRALARHGDEGHRRLLALLDAERSPSVLGALAGLEAAVVVGAAPRVARLLDRPEPEIRRQAAVTLGVLGTASELATMRRMFDASGDRELRVALARSAREILDSGR